MVFTAADMEALRLTLLLCALTTLLLIPLALPMAWWLAWTRSRMRGVAEVIVMLPLVLPPSVLGFYLLLALGPNGALGQTAEVLIGRHLAFSFEGMLIGSMLYSLPFAVQPLHDGFRAIGRGPLEVAATLGAGPLDRLFAIAIPLARRSIVTAMILVFAHTIGEFGVVLMIGGNLPGETQVLSIALYDAVEAFDQDRAHRLSLLLVGLAVVLLALLSGLRSRRAEHVV